MFCSNMKYCLSSTTKYNTQTLLAAIQEESRDEDQEDQVHTLFALSLSINSTSTLYCTSFRHFPLVGSGWPVWFIHKENSINLMIRTVQPDEEIPELYPLFW